VTIWSGTTASAIAPSTIGIGVLVPFVLFVPFFGFYTLVDIMYYYFTSWFAWMIIWF
jgi:hypothetical protein